jgi:lysophospholipase L1-like esterase
MKSAPGSSAGVVSATLALLCVLLWVRPFDRINYAMDAVVHAAPRWSQVETMYRDPRTQDVTHGADPRTSLETVRRYWQQEPSASKVMFIGNSQMLAMSLAPGEMPSPVPDKTYVDLLAQQFNALPDNPVLIYRLAAPGMSYAEALWYLEYVICNPGLHPSGIVLQLNYQAFWTGAIRDSLDDLMDNACFRARVHTIAASDAAYADDFQAAEKSYIHAHEQNVPVNPDPSAIAFGPRLETAFRTNLQKTSLFQDGYIQKDDFAQMLYRLRLYVLQVKPSNARSVTGPRLTKSQAALETIAQRCADEHIRLVLFSAPVNPAVSLYSSDSDRTTYTGFVQKLAAEHQLPFFDLEHAIDGQYWGRQFNSADPLHIGRKGHELLAADMAPVVRQAAVRKATSGE